jgi:hypothetical protein
LNVQPTTLAHDDVKLPRSEGGSEFGAAELRGLTVRERAHALVDIAHPDHRQELRKVTGTLGTR